MNMHTPGPWMWGLDTPDSLHTHTLLLRNWVEERSIIFHRAHWPVTEANARLMAAAPEMLALLLELTDIEGPQPGHVEWYCKVRAAIAKVEGSAP